MNNQINSIAILTVATNKYIYYWEQMIRSADTKLLNTDRKIVSHVLTENVKKAEEIKSQLMNIVVIIHPIQNYSWPEATLFRYRLYQEIKSTVTENLVMHLDADMIIMEDFLAKLPNEFMDGVALVRHPGFYRPPGLRKIGFYAKNRNYIRQDLECYLSMGALGDWEVTKKSTSYVTKKARDFYFCGGTWFGYRTAFFNLVNELAEIEKADTVTGFVPKWHDESILNHWASKNSFTILTPSYCFDPKYPQLAKLPEYIRAVTKNEIN